ncbi:unnamed protein product, partial [Choristocarpus tenellus]
CVRLVSFEQATEDGSPMLTHTADCEDCDFRLSKVAPRDWAEGSLRPVYLYHPQYPRLVSEERGATWTLENLLSDDLDQREAWEETIPIGYIPQVNHTHGLLETTYGIANDQGVAIGESTAAAAFFSLPVSEVSEGERGALLDVSELSK